MGGNNLEENLIPLCPNCHRIYAHELRDKFSSTLLNKVRNERLSLVSVEQEIRSHVSANPSRAAKLLLLDSTHDLVLRFGRYHRFLIMSKKIAQNISANTAADRVLKARVIVFGGEMALYSEQETQYASIVKESLLTFKQSKELMPILAGAELVAARLAGRTNSVREEQNYMEHEATIDTLKCQNISDEWLFRRIAYYKKKRNFEIALKLADKAEETILKIDSDNILKSNILSEIARIHLYTGQSLQAKKKFTEVLSISIAGFHRRGILITSIFLARANLALRNYSEAAENFLLASQCMDVARSNDKLALEEIHYSLEEELGTNWLTETSG